MAAASRLRVLFPVSYLPAFAAMLPGLLKAYDAAPTTDPLKAALKDQIDVLRRWDYRWASSSVATSLAVYWGEALGRLVAADARGTAGVRGRGDLPRRRERCEEEACGDPAECASAMITPQVVGRICQGKCGGTAKEKASQ